MTITDDGYVLYTDGEVVSLMGYIGTETDLVLPASVTDIYQYAFAYCTSLTSVTIPASVVNISCCAFLNATSVKSITFNNPSTWYRTNNYDNWNNKVHGTKTDVSDASSIATYLKSTYYKYYWYMIGEASEQPYAGKMVTFYIPGSTAPLPSEINSSVTGEGDWSSGKDNTIPYRFTGNTIVSGEYNYSFYRGRGYNYICVPSSKTISRIYDNSSTFELYKTDVGNDQAINFMDSTITIDGDTYKVYKTNARGTSSTSYIVSYKITIT